MWNLMGLVGRFHKEVCLASGKLQRVNTSAIAGRVHLAELRLSKKRVSEEFTVTSLRESYCRGRSAMCSQECTAVQICNAKVFYLAQQKNVATQTDVQVYSLHQVRN